VLHCSLAEQVWPSLKWVGRVRPNKKN
jgi:hypothetical protein